MSAAGRDPAGVTPQTALMPNPYPSEPTMVMSPGGLNTGSSNPYFGSTDEYAKTGGLSLPTSLPTVEANPSQTISAAENPSAGVDVYALLKAVSRFVLEQNAYMRAPKTTAQDFESAITRFSFEQAKFIDAQARALHQMGIL